MNPLSPGARQALERASELAEGGGVGPEHIFAAALEQVPELSRRLGWEEGVFARQLAALPGQGYTAEADQAVLMAARLTYLDQQAGSRSAEQTLLSLMDNPDGMLGQERERAGEILLERLMAGDSWTLLESEEPYKLAARQGRIQPSNGDYLRAVLSRPDSLAVTILRRLGFDLEALERVALEDQSPFHPVPNETALPVRPEQLLRAASHARRVQELARTCGVVPFRLEVALDRGLGRNPAYENAPARFLWVRPACEEAERLGGGMVSEFDLLLGLLADPDNLACKALRAAGMELDELRCTLERRTVTGEGFSPEARQVMESAAELAGGLHPHDGHMLLALLEVLATSMPEAPFPDIERELRKRLDGTLNRALPVSLDGLALEMTREQVIDRLGAPHAHGLVLEQERWCYVDGPTLVWHATLDSLVEVSGSRLCQSERTLLCRGDDGEQALTTLGRSLSVELANGWSVSVVVQPPGQVARILLSSLPQS